MDKKQITPEILIDTALADIAINDLGLTLDEPTFFSPYCPYVGYGIYSVFGNLIRLETLMVMTYHLCTLKDAANLAKKLAKKSGILNYKLSDTVTVTEDYIETGIKNCSKRLRNNEATEHDLELAVYYQQLFKEYCLKYMSEEQLEQAVKTKMEAHYTQQNNNFEQNPIL